ncbi:MAG: hypothetical protein IBX55_08970 [Methyloprofundus sp.]|nr:hypothetical protein [Methyloprofundus sp.]
MYLEEKIDKLTELVLELKEELAALAAVKKTVKEEQDQETVKQATISKETVKQATISKETVKQATISKEPVKQATISKDELQAYALKRVRIEGAEFKAKLIAALNAKNAKTINQLNNDEQATEVYIAIGGAQ